MCWCCANTHSPLAETVQYARIRIYLCVCVVLFFFLNKKIQRKKFEDSVLCALGGVTRGMRCICVDRDYGSGYKL